MTLNVKLDTSFLLDRQQYTLDNIGAGLIGTNIFTENVHLLDYIECRHASFEILGVTDTNDLQIRILANTNGDTLRDALEINQNSVRFLPRIMQYGYISKLITIDALILNYEK